MQVEGEVGAGEPAGGEVAPGSVAHVSGEACGSLTVGGAVAVAPDLVVTNAHVVAGLDDVDVLIAGSAEPVAGTVVSFDANRDLALVRVVDGSFDAVDFASIDEGGQGRLVTVDDEGDVEERPFEVARPINAVGEDIYRNDGADRRALEVQLEVVPGESGSGLFDRRGSLVGLLFASSRTSSGRSYAVATDEIEAFIDEAAADPRPVGPCLR